MQFVDVIVGGQYGSEAKGHVTAQLVGAAIRDARREDTPDIDVYNVRVAGPNAGHTVYDAEGRKYAFRSLPVGAVIDPEVRLYIAPGSEVDPEVLFSEIELCEERGWGLTGRLYVSRQATVITDEHKAQEAELVGKVGSTGKGIGAARAARLLRVADTMGAYYGDRLVPWEWAEPEDLYAADEFAHSERGTHVLIEGTQGYGLSLRASGHYPQVTSSDARAVDFLAMAGVDPTRCGLKLTNWIVARVFPIRVAGNSGPMKGETTWGELGLAEEHTTVTQKVRRVGEWDQDLLRRAVQANGGHNAKVVITMLDQVIPELASVDSDAVETYSEDSAQGQALNKAMAWIEEHANYEQIGAHVAGITFSPTDLVFTNHAFDGMPGGAGGELPPELQQAMQSAMQELFGGATGGR